MRNIQSNKPRCYFFIILCFLLLTGCSEQAKPSSNEKDETKVKKEIVNKDKEEEKADEEIPKAPRDLEGMIAQGPGKLVEKHMDPELEILDGWDYFKYSKFIDEKFTPIVNEELQAYFEKNKDLTSDQVYDYLVYQLASGQYKSNYEKLISYEHGYVMPELPDGEDEIELAKKQKTNVVILMDASGSMKANVPGGVKMDLAKETIKQFTDQLEEDVNVSLFAYGHIGSGKDSDKEKSCQSIESLYPLGSYEGNKFNEAMNSFQASGWTPLAGAIEKANELLSNYPHEEYKNIVYIVSDGIETCGGNPVEAAKKLNESKIEAKVNIIGFDVDDVGQKQLKQVAEAGGGDYATVRDRSEFEDVILKKWKPSIMQVFSQQGILLNEYVDQQKRLIDIHSPLYNASEREASRIIMATFYLQNKELVSREIGSAVREKAEEMRDLRNDHFKAIKEEKELEAKQASDEIDAKVEAWKDKWLKELENE
ncbi:vWA domain-containing protein [Cytobacillus dafuensis]|uniref:VWA domain-containing protein n=1 Tax=Cytobacillus dafuensis TaxID=1742359 RepID=A0A5B8Z092_CYTDA|nr:VWA domain-containing protein [Cytobacillus dafuensis]QED46434.1 VWA domain-containing protein [Cytobacillus dafuensis]